MKLLMQNEVYKCVYRPTKINSIDSYLYVDSKDYCKNRIDLSRMFRVLEEKILTLFRYIEPSISNMEVYSYEISNLLISVCVEVENCLKEVLVNNSRKKEENMTIKDYFKLSPLLKLSEYEFILAINQDLAIKPFKQWGNNNHSLAWYQAYNAVKHQRSNNLAIATLGHLLSAFAGLYALHLSMFGPFATLQSKIYPRGSIVVELDDGNTKGPVITGTNTLFVPIKTPKFLTEEEYDLVEGQIRFVSANLVLGDKNKKNKKNQSKSS